MRLNLKNVWALIPARGGSVGVPRKNLRVVGGKPLIRFTIATALSVLDADHVIVITDDKEIEAVSREAGAQVIFESSPTPGDETLDTKIIRNLPALKKFGAHDDDIVLTLQPTSPLLPSNAILQATELLESGGCRSVLTVVESRHLEWIKLEQGGFAPAYTKRVNRQHLPPKYRETGGIIGARLGDIVENDSRVIEPVALIELSDEEGIDIDTFSDLSSVEHLLTRLKIFIRTDAAPRLGMGHVYRAAAIATELARHDITIFTEHSLPLGKEFFDHLPYKNTSIGSEEEFVAEVAKGQPDIVILDVLDTNATLLYAIRGAAPGVKITTFEDTGTGATVADVVVSEFIPTLTEADKTLSGIDNSILAPAFELGSTAKPFNVEVENVLILFGGTDPSGLAQKSLQSLSRLGYSKQVTVVRGLGAPPLDTTGLNLAIDIVHHVDYMPGIMKRADFAFTSIGRTIIELIQMGVPSIAMAQNQKELSHTHAKAEWGVEMLGLGTEVSNDDLDRATARMLYDVRHRRELQTAAQLAFPERSNRRTIGKVFDLLGFDSYLYL